MTRDKRDSYDDLNANAVRLTCPPCNRSWDMTHRKRTCPNCGKCTLVKRREPKV